MAPHLDTSSPVASVVDACDNTASHPASGLSSTSTVTPPGPADLQDQLGPSSHHGSSTQESGARAPRPLEPGVYVPTVCFFDPDTEDLDTATIARHAVWLARAGVQGLATQGSNGEAVHLSAAERARVTATTRRALDGAGFARVPVLVGCGAQSVRETAAHCRAAAAAGGDYALVLPPAYYAAQFAPGSVRAYFRAVADASPLPLLLYNYPGATGGAVDLSSDDVLALAAHPRIVGVKLTCGNTGKLNRIVAGLSSASSSSSSSSATTTTVKGSSSSSSASSPGFLVLGGSADFATQTLVGGGHGVLAGLANLAPRAVGRTVARGRAGAWAAAAALQGPVARADGHAIRGGVVGLKAALQAHRGYGGFARAPLPRPAAAEVAAWRDAFAELVRLERELADRPADDDDEDDKDKHGERAAAE
ncbi:dihydrodipicolinate synthetase [Xylariomycetidae sp. FL0641]|nr:dihydrodipicolinate synthetase [Xylariomycetidae sp. FL0641]